MNHEILAQYLNENEFHLDPLGRVVIDDPEILKAINGALGSTGGLDDALLNGACANAGCS